MATSTATSNFTNNFGKTLPALAKANTLNNSALAPGQFNGTPSVGIKTKSPIDTIKPPVNTTPQPQTKVAQGGGKTTDGGTVGSISPAPGSMVVKAPNDPTNQFNTATGQPNVNYKDPNAPVPAPTPTPTNVGYSPTDTGLYGKLVTDLANRSTQSGQDYKDSQAEAKRISDEQTALAGDYAHKTNNIAGTAGFLTQQSGLQGQLNNQYNTVQNALSSQYSGATNRISAANSQQGLLQQALSSAAGAAAPQFGVQYGTGVSNPITGQLNSSGGNFGTGPEAASNAQTVRDNATKINDINSQSTSVDNNFSRAINYATGAGLDNNSSILAGLQNKFKGNAQGSTQIAGFNQVIGQLNQQATALGFAPVDPANVTPAQLAQLQETVKKGLANQVANYQSENDKLNGKNTPNSGNTMFGSFF